MALSGPQKIPGASLNLFFGNRYSGSAMEVNCGVVHTTEGMSLVSYSNGASAPNVTGVPDFKAKKIRWHQHFDVDRSARALMNKSGGVETNSANVFQIELVGTCDDKHKTSWSGKKAGVDYIHWPTAPDWALREVAWLVRWLNTEHKIPLTCTSMWLAYGKDSRRPGITPASYGASPARMSMTTWRSFKGWCGHQHVPENDHGDPGNLDMARIIAYAKGQTPETEEEDPLMGFTKKDVYDAVMGTDAVPAPNSSPTAKTNKTWTLSSYVQTILNTLDALREEVAGFRAEMKAFRESQQGK